MFRKEKHAAKKKKVETEHLENERGTVGSIRVTQVMFVKEGTILRVGSISVV